jgi:hypothetical protein
VDQNGIPIIKNVVLGEAVCELDLKVPCGACNWKAGTLLVTFLLNNDIFTQEDAQNWEKEVFEANID